MNRSYSKIRHIQEANQQLEKRLLSEQNKTLLNELLPVVAAPAASLIGAGLTALGGIAYKIIASQGSSGDKVKELCDLCKKSNAQITQKSNQLADEVRDAVQGAGTYEEGLSKVFQNLSSFDEFCSLVNSYQKSYDVDLYSDLDGDIDSESEWVQIFRPLRDILLRKQQNDARNAKSQSVAGNPLTQNAGYNKGIYQNQFKPTQGTKPTQVKR